MTELNTELATVTTGTAWGEEVTIFRRDLWLPGL